MHFLAFGCFRVYDSDYSGLGTCRQVMIARPPAPKAVCIPPSRADKPHGVNELARQRLQRRKLRVVEIVAVVFPGCNNKQQPHHEEWNWLDAMSVTNPRIAGPSQQLWKLVRQNESTHACPCEAPLNPLPSWYGEKRWHGYRFRDQLKGDPALAQIDRAVACR